MNNQQKTFRHRKRNPVWGSIRTIISSAVFPLLPLVIKCLVHILFLKTIKLTLDNFIMATLANPSVIFVVISLSISITPEIHKFRNQSEITKINTILVVLSVALFIFEVAEGYDFIGNQKRNDTYFWCNIIVLSGTILFDVIVVIASARLHPIDSLSDEKITKILSIINNELGDAA
ncbi:hypothetical protein AGMMS49992_32150 [Clostridia bacterium]|nr:hypothetical protein AGMMS49992_32150 [Clostridia bacterium]